MFAALGFAAAVIVAVTVTVVAFLFHYWYVTVAVATLLWLAALVQEVRFARTTARRGRHRLAPVRVAA